MDGAVGGVDAQLRKGADRILVQGILLVHYDSSDHEDLHLLHCIFQKALASLASRRCIRTAPDGEGSQERGKKDCLEEGLPPLLGVLELKRAAKAHGFRHDIGLKCCLILWSISFISRVCLLLLLFWNLRCFVALDVISFTYACRHMIKVTQGILLQLLLQASSYIPQAKTAW